VQDDRLRLELLELLVGRRDEHRLREQGVVGVVGDDPHVDAVLRIGAGEGVDDVEVAVGEVGRDLGAKAVEAILLERPVHIAPPDALLGGRLPHDELVLRRAAGVAAGVDDERPALGEHALAPAQRVRVEDGRGQVPVNPAAGFDAVGGQVLVRRRRHAGHGKRPGSGAASRSASRRRA
jgi:hypothetical protein